MPSNNITKMRTLIERTLKSDERLWTQTKTADQPELNQTKLLDLIEKTDERVITLLFNESSLRTKFFVKIDASHVFKTNDFRFFMEQNKINNSYTDYKNRIGLTDGRRFLKDTQDVVLNFPFKDGILQGGQSTEEGEDTYFAPDKEGQYKPHKAKRKEIFFNQVLAQDEIDRLKEPKALVNWKRYAKDGAGEVQALKRDANGMLKENLIIKGNNLLALHSLKTQFVGKVKLIYIDPPYNTGNDGFKYNDNFNHSTWLTFMQNRLEIARELLRDDGVIFVQCDDNEQAYLKVLMDEVFERKNFVNTVIHNNKYTTSNDAKYISSQHENIHIFGKIKNKWSPNLLPRTKEMDASYKNPDNDIRGAWKATPLHAKSGTENNIYTITFGNGINWTPPKGRYPRYSKENLKLLYESGQIYFNKKGGMDKKTYLSEVKQGKTIGSLWKYDDVGSTHQSNEEIASIVGKGVFDSPKPERLLQRIIEISTKAGDIVLDYHLGSGTTCAVAHKMGRQYIGIEQMDYIETIAVERLKKVIAGEQGGISKAVEWQGGGDFVYCELAEWNEQAKRKIEACQSLAELEKLFNTLYEKYFLNYNLKLKEFKEEVLKEPAFRELSLDKHKQMFIAMLDNNQMYTCKSEMADSKYNIDSTDQKLTTNFYN